ncbi:hypothetical protein [Chondrinema litorale]|uniref:hypothetical protein n=1 Tax=Chondrinema litorale TaxID=2994555 RepID=UPI0025439742|nr:hypothetical protein [Chondrinema litorale]UZR98661.1 hypothetical protein OQ292_32135 [Chondrinema litorale]
MELTYSQKVDRSIVSSSVWQMPWFIYSALIATTSIITGLIWDISWHLSIGRDGLFSPPHLLIYLGGLLAGIGGGYLMIKTTFFGTQQEKEKAVWFWGFRSPLSALFLVWGALAMLTSAPFDDWWHNAYGLDVEILSPPHTLLAMGMIMVQLGSVIQLLSYQNSIKNYQTENGLIAEKKLKLVQTMYVYTVGMLIAIVGTILSEYLSPNHSHASIFYIVGGAAYPLFLISAGRASGLKMPITTAALFYMAVQLFMIWLLPLFPATPKLGPVVNPITHYVPYEFPHLLIIPAVLLDLFRNKFELKNDWLNAVCMGAIFFVSFLAIQWNFGAFLLSDYAKNWMFIGDAVAYNWNPDWKYRNEFYPWLETGTASLLKGLAWALLITMLSTRIGLWWGNWMKAVKR